MRTGSISLTAISKPVCRCRLDTLSQCDCGSWLSQDHLRPGGGLAGCDLKDIVAAQIGTVPAIVVGGVGAIAVVGLWAYLFPALRKVRHLNGRN